MALVQANRASVGRERPKTQADGTTSLHFSIHRSDEQVGNPLLTRLGCHSNCVQVQRVCVRAQRDVPDVYA